MSNENTSLKNVTPAGDSNTTHEMVVAKSITYQRPVLIVAGSLLALLVWIAATGTNGGQYLQSSAHENAEGAVTVTDYQVDSANLGLTKNIFDLGDDEGCSDFKNDYDFWCSTFGVSCC